MFIIQPIDIFKTVDAKNTVSLTYGNSQNPNYGAVSAVQKEAFPLAGGLTIVNVQTLAHNLTKPDTRWHKAAFYMWDYSLCKSGAANQSPEFIGDCHSAKFSAQNLSKPDIGKGADGSDEGFSDLTTRNADEFKYTLGGSFVPNTRGEFSDSIKKASTVNANPLIYSTSSLWRGAKSRLDYSLGFLLCSGRLVWLCAMSTIARISTPVLMPISSILAKAIKASFRFDTSLLSSLSFNWRRVISPCMAVTMKPALLSPSVLTASIPSITSCGIRAVTDWDFALVEPVAIDKPSGNWCLTVYTKVNYTKGLMCKPLAFIFNYTLSTDKAQVAHKIAKPGSGGTLTGPLTQPLKQVTVMADKQHTQTRPKYQYRFLALNRADRAATPCRLSVEAETEREARQVLVRDFILVLAGRLPVKGVSHVA